MVSAIIPARNEEASIGRAVESVAAQPEVSEVIVVNDESTDRTGEILAELATRMLKLRILSTDALPAGWTGKNYALSIGAAAAQGDWLLFTDADTFHLPGSTARVLTDAKESNAALVSYSPEQEMGTFWERALIPRVYWVLSRRYSFDNVNDPAKPDAAANGQFLLIRRDAYSAVGGQAAVASEILEDVALARRVKRAGYRLHFWSGDGIVRTRMYRSFGSMWDGWTKNLYPLIGNSKMAMADELVDPTLLALVVVCLLSRPYDSVDWLILTVGLWAIAGQFIQFVTYLRKNRLPVSLIQYFVPGMYVYSAALVTSWWKSTHGAVTWKGRAYPAKTSVRSN